MFTQDGSRSFDPTYEDYTSPADPYDTVTQAAEREAEDVLLMDFEDAADPDVVTPTIMDRLAALLSTTQDEIGIAVVA